MSGTAPGGDGAWLRRLIARWLAQGVPVSLILSCGYTPLYSSGHEQYALVGSPPLAGDAAVLAGVESGARTALARAGRLRVGSSFPRVVTQVVRIDVVGSGIGVLGSSPRSRGTRFAVTARAWVERAADAPIERESGDVRVVELAAVQPDAVTQAVVASQALTAAAARLGDRLGRLVLGEPAPLDEGM